jgi:hypothetical protein
VSVTKPRISNVRTEKKNGKVFRSKFVGTGPSSYEKRIDRAAVSQRLRNPALHDLPLAGMFLASCTRYTSVLIGDCNTPVLQVQESLNQHSYRVPGKQSNGLNSSEVMEHFPLYLVLSANTSIVINPLRQIYFTTEIN